MITARTGGGQGAASDKEYPYHLVSEYLFTSFPKRLLETASSTQKAQSAKSLLHDLVTNNTAPSDQHIDPPTLQKPGWPHAPY